MGLVGSGGVSGKVSTTCESTTVNADLVSSGPIGVDCSTVATALEEALGEWKREGRVFEPAHRKRAAVVGMARAPAELVPTLQAPSDADADERPARRGALPWAELLRRVFAIEILKCDQCGGDMKIIAIIPASAATEAISDHLGIDTHDNSATGPPRSASAARA